jgi:hypothetical protein
MKKYSRIAEVRKRYGGCSSRTIDRNVQLGIIAPPEYLHGIRIWDDDLLDEYDARRQSGTPPAPRSSGGRGQPRKSTVDSWSTSAKERKTENAELCPEDQGAPR